MIKETLGVHKKLADGRYCGMALYIGVQLEGQNFDFIAHLCTWIKKAYLLAKFPLFPAMPAVEMPLAALLQKFQFKDTYPQKINTNR